MQPAPYYPQAATWELTQTEAFLARVYRWMAIGLGVTGFVAAGVSALPELMTMLYGTGLIWGVLILQVVLALAFTPLARTVSPPVAGGLFVLYAGLTGVGLSGLFWVYTGASLATAFLITAGTFTAMSAYGLLTKKSLASWGSFLLMGLVGVILASVVNLFLGSPMVSWIASVAGVVVFTGLIAYDTQMLKDMAPQLGENGAVQGALVLYLDFINVFLRLLQLFGSRRD
ncbi:MAG: Bax inhibitor-1/YccA family protein [Deltaproteobacteria bacterium]|nr:Bax inhibitor-1/YccA family protein [Deltaproteobacteria bacterium]